MGPHGSHQLEPCPNIVPHNGQIFLDEPVVLAGHAELSRRVVGCNPLQALAVRKAPIVALEEPLGGCWG
jgi:hypothetical protein